MAEKSAKQETVFDTDLQYLGSVYAKALLRVGRDAGKIEQILDELESFVEALSAVDGIRLALESPRVSFGEKEALLDKITKGKSSDEFNNFLKVLARKGRFSCLGAVRTNARRLFNEIAGRVEARLTTAAEIPEEVKNQVAERLSKQLGKQIELATSVDPEIIGGMVVRVGDTVYDASIANELQRVRHSAMQRANQQIRESLEKFAGESST